MGDLNNEEKGYDFSKFKSKYWYIPHMYGIELPKYITDKKNKRGQGEKIMDGCRAISDEEYNGGI